MSFTRLTVVPGEIHLGDRLISDYAPYVWAGAPIIQIESFPIDKLVIVRIVNGAKREFHQYTIVDVYRPDDLTLAEAWQSNSIDVQ